MHCRGCGYTWRPVKKRHASDKRWIEAYLLDGSSVRRLAVRWGVSQMTAWRRIVRSLDQRIGVATVVAKRNINTLSIIMLDAKHFKIRKNKYSLYVMFDVIHRSPSAWVLLPHAEKREGYDMLLELARREKARIEAIVSDWHHTIKASVHGWYPSAVHQRCASHLLQEVFRRICGKRLLATPAGKKLWKKIRTAAIGCDDVLNAQRRLSSLKRFHPRYTKAWQKFQNGIVDIFEWNKRTDLPIPRTSNLIENCMGVIEQRMKSMRTMKNPTVLAQMISAYLKIKYRKTNQK